MNAKPAGEPLAARIAAAMNEAGAVTKDGRNREQGYDYASVESILTAVREPLLSRGIMLIPRVAATEVEEVKSSGGKAGTSVIISVDFTFTDGVDELVVPAWRGAAIDYGDKAFGKAYTNAIKTFIRTAWLLPTGDDPERDNPERVAKGSGGTAPELPGWAKPTANNDRLAEIGAALVPLIGRSRAKAFVATVRNELTYVPDVIVASTKLLAAYMDGALEDTGHATAHKRELEVAEQEAAQDAKRKAAEEEAQAASGEPEPEPRTGADLSGSDGQGDPEPDDDPEPEPEDGPGDHDASKVPPAGTVDPPALAEHPNDAEAEQALRQAGCTCPEPLVAAGRVPGLDPKSEAAVEAVDDTCPIRGHGIPF